MKCLGSFGLEVKFWLGLHSPHLSLIPVLIKFKDRNISSLCEHQQYTLPQVQTVSRPTTGISVPISSLQWESCKLQEWMPLDQDTSECWGCKEGQGLWYSGATESSHIQKSGYRCSSLPIAHPHPPLQG